MRIAILAGGKAIEYGVGVGREGFTLTRQRKASRKTEWPELPATQGWNVRVERSPHPGTHAWRTGQSDGLRPRLARPPGGRRPPTAFTLIGKARLAARDGTARNYVDERRGEISPAEIGGQIAALRKAFMHLAADAG